MPRSRQACASCSATARSSSKRAAGALRVEIISYAQGFVQLQEASREHGWGLRLRRLRAAVAGRLHHSRAVPRPHQEAFDARAISRTCCSPVLPRCGDEGAAGVRAVVAAANVAGVPVPAFATALAYYDGYRRERLPANLLQRSATTSARTPSSAPTDPARSTRSGSSVVARPGPECCSATVISR